MPRSIGYGVIGWNRAPWAVSGYYPVAKSQAFAFDMRQYVAKSQTFAYDVTNAVAKQQTFAYDVSPLGRRSGDVALAAAAGHAGLVRRGGDVALVRTNP